MTSSADRPPAYHAWGRPDWNQRPTDLCSLVARMFGDQNLIDDVARRAMSFGSRRVLERLGITPDEMKGGHGVALSRPKELAARLHGYPL
jgi:hypothetical protein